MKNYFYKQIIIGYGENNLLEKNSGKYNMRRNKQ